MAHVGPSQQTVPQSASSRKLANKSNWRAVIVTSEWHYVDERNSLPKEVKDSETKVHLAPGEKGISISTRNMPSDPQFLEHRVQFTRYDITFDVVVPETHLQVGAPYRSLEEKLLDFYTLHKPELDNVLLQWSRQGSDIDRYVKALWLGIRAQRDKLVALGLPRNAASGMFGQEHLWLRWTRFVGCFSRNSSRR
ncbi:hypothetical protein VTI74DRAFT_6200 [Chaetomium olivicolor]